MVAPKRKPDRDHSEDSEIVPLRLRVRMGDPPPVVRTPEAVSPRFGFRDASRLALVFLGIALANMLVLLLALWVLRYGATDPALPILDPIPQR